MTTVICPSCASVIDMEQEIPFGYCKVCGDRISYADASTLKISKELLESKERLQAIKPEVLFTIAKFTRENYGEDLMKISAEKGHLPANLHLGIKYYSTNKWDECKKYLEVAAKGGSNDAEALLIVLQYRNSSSDAESMLTKLKKACEKNFENESISKHCEEYITTIQRDIWESKNTRNYSALPDYTAYPIMQSAQEDSYGPIDYGHVYDYNPATNTFTDADGVTQILEGGYTIGEDGITVHMDVSDY